MKRTLLALLVLVGLGSATIAHAGNPFDWIWTLNDSSGDPYTFPMSGSFSPDDPRVLVYIPGIHQPQLLALNGGVQVDPMTNQLVVDNIPQARVQTLVSDLAGKAPLSHTHTVAQITDIGGYVTALINAAATSSQQVDWANTNTASSTFIKNKPSMVFATTSRSLNTAFQVSATRAAFVSYTVDVASTLSLLAGETGTVVLEYADDSGFTTNVKTVQSVVSGNAGTLTLGLGLTQTTSASLTGIIPAGKYVRIRTINTTGTPTFTYRAEQEVFMAIN